MEPRRSLGWPILLGVVLIGSIIALGVGWVLVSIAAALGSKNSAFYYALLGVGVALLGVALRRVLPATPVLRDVFLAPPAAGPLADSMLDDMIGADGTTTTRLAPAGKARIGGAVRDVTTDGELIEPGMPVRVVAVRGRRVVVRMA